MSRHMSGVALVKLAATVAVLLLTALVLLLPVYYMAVIANQPDQSDLSVVWFHGFHIWDNLGAVMNHTYRRQLLNSLFVCGAIATLDVIFAGAGGYALAKMRFPTRGVLFGVVVTTLALSPIAVVIPVYVMMYRIHWLNSYQALILPGMISAFGVFLVRQFALGIPQQLIN